MTLSRDSLIRGYLTLFNDPAPDWGLASTLLAPEYRFSDPFHQLTGADALRRYLHQFHQHCDAVRFTPERIAWDGDYCLLRWRFEARWKGRPVDFRGVSELRCDAAGRIAEHVDYWDAAEQFYARLPLLGGLLRALKRRIQRALSRAP